MRSTHSLHTLRRFTLVAVSASRVQVTMRLSSKEPVLVVKPTRKDVLEGNTNNQLVLLLGGADTIAKRSIEDSRDVSHIIILLSSSGLGLLNIFSRSSFLFLNGFNDGGYG